MCFVQYATIQDSRKVLNHFVAANYVTPTNFQMTAHFSKRKFINRSDKQQRNAPPPVIVPEKEIPVIQAVRSHVEAKPSKVLLVTLRPVNGNQLTVTAENMLLPFSRYGIVHKVIVWGKKDKTDLNALVQYSSLEYSAYAKEKMDGITIGEFKAQIRYSERAEIDIAQNNERMRDFSNPWLSSSDMPPRV